MPSVAIQGSDEHHFVSVDRYLHHACDLNVTMAVLPGSVRRWVTVVCVSLSCLGHCPAVGHCRACVPVLPVLLGSLSSGGSLSCVCAICPEWLIVVRVSLSCLGHTVLFGLLTCVCVTVGRAWVTVLSCLDHCPEWGALFCRAWTSHC